MKAEQARKELRQLLKEQKTVRVSRLRLLLNSMNIPLRKLDSDPQEVAYLKKRIEALQKENLQLRKLNNRPRRMRH